ncbi:uncharacterized protein LOC122250009 isoform X2 [Penaeus japonicus]|uniref:uncharacterized protein LOC122250009 isoform X2 n=1 Tax=Penaeus japonicus TaxID=27405 RepID=UPI001C717924|nr:uncharacterized protein LOC122250009 isoform X2 [Penaeus japonicus]
MKLPSKSVLEQILEHHTGKKMRISKDAASYMFLRYVIYMKELAKKSDAVAFRVWQTGNETQAGTTAQGCILDNFKRSCK